MNRTKIKDDISMQDKAVSFIAENVIITGDVQSKAGVVEILGTVNGNCNIDNLTIRETGLINGDVTGDVVKIKGRVNGNISGNSVIILANATVVGDIGYVNLSVEDGADIDGKCKRKKESESNINGKIDGKHHNIVHKK